MTIQVTRIVTPEEVKQFTGSSFGYVKITDSDYVEAKKTKDQPESKHYKIKLDSKTKEAVQKTFETVINDYIKLGDQETDNVKKAIYYTKARIVLKKELNTWEVKELKRDLTYKLGGALFFSSLGQKNLEIRANLMFNATYILGSNLKKIPSNYEDRHPRKDELLSKCWEKLGDIFLEDEKNKLFYFTPLLADTSFLRATYCYENAARAFRNASYFSSFTKTNQYKWSDYDIERERLLDKAINTVENTPCQKKDIGLSAFLSQKLGELYETKKHLYQLSKKPNPEMEKLISTGYENRKEAAKLFGKFAKQDEKRNYASFYSEAINWHVLTLYPNTVKEASKISEKALEASKNYLKYSLYPKSLEEVYWQPQGKTEQKICDIICRKIDINEYLEKLGPDTQMPKPLWERENEKTSEKRE